MMDCNDVKKLTNEQLVQVTVWTSPSPGWYKLLMLPFNVHEPGVEPQFFLVGGTAGNMLVWEIRPDALYVSNRHGKTVRVPDTENDVLRYGAIIARLGNDT